MSMRLQDVISIHDAYRDWTPLVGNVGDGFLYCGNPLYRAVRDRVTELGVRFTRKDFCSYNIAPLGALGAILRAKNIPYNDNVVVLRNAERRRPGTVLDNMIGVKRNLLMHEAAHCVADHELPKAHFRSKRLTNARRTSLRAMMGESFATCTEVLGQMFADTEVHRFFYEKNTYCDIAPQVQKHLRDCVDLIGFSATAQVLFLSFLLSNQLYKELRNSDCKRVLKLVGVSLPLSSQRRALFELCRFGLRLDISFRLSTASFYMRYEFGIEQDIFSLFDYDVLGVLERDEPLMTNARTLCGILAGID